MPVMNVHTNQDSAAYIYIEALQQFNQSVYFIESMAQRTIEN